MGELPREHLVEDDSHRVDVRATIDGGIAPELLGRHVRRRAHGGARLGQLREGIRPEEQSRDPEVEDLDPLRALIRLREEDVGRLEIAVDDAAGVHRAERLEELDGERDRAVGGQGPFPLQALVEPLPLEVLHHEKRPFPNVDVEVEELRHPGTRDLRRGARLALEAPDVVLVLGDRRQQDLHGHPTIHRLVPSLVDGAHPAHAEEALEEVAPPERAPHEPLGPLLLLGGTEHRDRKVPRSANPGGVSLAC